MVGSHAVRCACNARGRERSYEGRQAGTLVIDATTIDLRPERFAAGVPFDDLRWLRENEPVWWSSAMACWVVTSYELVEQCNRDWTRFSSSDGVVDPADAGAPKWKPITALDPPEHGRYRRLVMAPFTPIPIGRLEDMVRRIAREAIASFVAEGGGDFVNAIACAVPFRVMATLTGVPFDDEDLIVGWTNSVMPNADPDYRPTESTAEASRVALGAYCVELARAQRTGERPLLSQTLFEGRLGERELSDEEVANFLDTFIVGGTETTRQLISHGLLALLEHPDQCRRLVDGTVTGAVAVEEMLRWVSPVLHHSRRATQDAAVGEVGIGAGDRVTLWIVSANRDPHVFSAPDAFDVGRTPNPHVSLGAGGPHHCLGAHLARLEARVVFEELRPLLSRLTMSAPPVRVASNFFNGMKRFPLELAR
jgi:cholest-4-en-3-one 26-monooxygenase